MHNKDYTYWDVLNKPIICFLLFLVVFSSTLLSFQLNRMNELGFWMVVISIITYILFIVLELLSARTTINLLKGMKVGKNA